MSSLVNKTTKKDTFDVTLEFEAGKEVVSLPPLTKLDFVKLENDLGTDVKQQITSKFQALTQKADDQGMDIRDMNYSEIQELSDDDQGINIFSELGTKGQLYMFYYVFCKIDDELANMPKEEGLEIVSDWITNAMKDPAEYWECLLFMFYGRSREKLEEEADVLEEKGSGGSGKGS